MCSLRFPTLSGVTPPGARLSIAVAGSRPTRSRSGTVDNRITRSHLFQARFLASWPSPSSLSRALGRVFPHIGGTGNGSLINETPERPRGPTRFRPLYLRLSPALPRRWIEIIPGENSPKLSHDADNGYAGVPGDARTQSHYAN